jgi:hypothetical protein
MMLIALPSEWAGVVGYRGRDAFVPEFVRTDIDWHAQEGFQIQPQSFKVEQRETGRGVDQQVEVAFFCVVSARCRTEQTRVAHTGSVEDTQYLIAV